MRQECGNAMFVPRQGFLKVGALRKMFAQLIDGSVEGLQAMVFGLAIGKCSCGEVGFDFFKCSDGGSVSNDLPSAWRSDSIT